MSLLFILTTIPSLITSISNDSPLPSNPTNKCKSTPSLTNTNWQQCSSKGCHYTCAPGYFYSDQQRLTFIENRYCGIARCHNNQWEPSVCEKMCPKVPKIENGVYLNRKCSAESFKNETLCKYACDDDYVPGDDALSIAINGTQVSYTQCVGGEWVHRPNCVQKPGERKAKEKCDPSEIVPLCQNATINSCGGDECQFTCAEGFFTEMSSSSQPVTEGTALCVGGKWQTPFCEPLCTFGFREIIQADFLDDWCQGDVLVGSPCYYRCHNGFAVDLAYARAVMFDGKPAGVVFCVEDVLVNLCRQVEALMPARPPCYLSDVDLTAVGVNLDCLGGSGVSEGTTCSFSCNSGYFEQSALSRFDCRCGSRGWINQPVGYDDQGILDRGRLTCAEGCTPLTIDSAINVQGNCANGPVVVDGTICAVTCVSGQLVINNHQTASVQCSSGSWFYDGNVINPAVKCRPINPSLESSQSTKCVGFSTGYGVRKNCNSVLCKVWCTEGNLIGYDTPVVNVICGEGEWIVESDISKRRTTFSYPFACQHLCPPLRQYIPSVHSSTCMRNQSVPSQVSCTAICDESVISEIGTSQATFFCKEGDWHIDDGSNIRKVNNTFDCAERQPLVVCEDLPSLVNGIFSGKGCVEDALNSTKCSFTCQNGFTAEPMSTSQCECALGEIMCLNGAWEKPLCVLKDKVSPEIEECVNISQNLCGDLPEIVSGYYLNQTEQNQTEQNQTALPGRHFACDGKYYTINGQNLSDQGRINCVKGVWETAVCFPLSEAVKRLDSIEITVTLSYNPISELRGSIMTLNDGQHWKLTNVKKIKLNDDSSETAILKVEQTGKGEGEHHHHNEDDNSKSMTENICFVVLFSTIVTLIIA